MRSDLKLAAIVVALLLTALSLGGDATLLRARNGSVVRESHMNQFYDALTEAVLPRNSAGVPTHGAGSLGSATRRWSHAYATGITVGTQSTSFSFSSTGITGPNASIARSSVKSAIGQQTSAMSGTYSSTSFTDVTGGSIEITTTGRPVTILLQASFSHVLFPIEGGASEVSTALRVLRDAEIVFTTRLGFLSLGANGVNFPGGIEHLDIPTSGTYTYKVQVADVGGLDTEVTGTLVVFEE